MVVRHLLSVSLRVTERVGGSLNRVGGRPSSAQRQLPFAPYALRASAICRDMIVIRSYAVCDAATDVISAWSYAGATSTTSADTRLQDARPRRISRSSREVRPPASGVPVPGAWAGSRQSMSMEM